MNTPESEFGRRNGAGLDPLTIGKAERDAQELGWTQAIYWVIQSFTKSDMAAETLRLHLQAEVDAIGRGL